MRNGGRGRVVLSCIPCYTKKQKCDRRYPCSHCIRRRQPEQCVYSPSQASQAFLQTARRLGEDELRDDDAQHQGQSGEKSATGLSNWIIESDAMLLQESESLAQLYGYAEYSDSNTMALIRKFSLASHEIPMVSREIPSDSLDEIDDCLKRLPSRKVSDFLIQYYVTDVHWIDQIVYLPWFLEQYQQWWTLSRSRTNFDVEFAVLFLRICSYASQYLTSSSEIIDHICGMSLGDVRHVCHETAERLYAVCVQLNPRGALIRVQHLLALGLQKQCEGLINAFWETLGDAVRVAQRLGLHRGKLAWTHGMHDFDKEIRCRVFCNLYIWDSLISRQLDCPPFLPDVLSSCHVPQMRAHTSRDQNNAPEIYSERLMEARLVSFWRGFIRTDVSNYDPITAEERFERFCNEYLTQLPPELALEPCKDWDERLEKLPLQRQLLHIAIFESLCYNFRPVLLIQAHNLPAYKQLLMASQKRNLAAAALKVLAVVSRLHTMLGGSHTRLAPIIMPTFEASVVLVSLLVNDQLSDTNVGIDGIPTPDMDPLRDERLNLTRKRCFHTVQEALARLHTLAEVSSMAGVGANALGRLITQLPSDGFASL